MRARRAHRRFDPATFGDRDSAGESDAMLIPLGQFARNGSNPLFRVIVDRIDAAVKADAP